MVRKYSSLIFILSILAVSVYYGYPDMLFKRPQSIHAWRQADGASFALNYYQQGMHFFQPEVNNLTSLGGTSGKTAPGENTYLYYFVAVLYHIFGYHEFLFRLVFSLIFITGLFFLYKSIRYLFNDAFWAASVPILLFTSPVIVYYGNNFLPNTAALAFAFIAWYWFFRYINENRDRFMYISMLFFLLAGWLKITALVSLSAIGAIFILEWIFDIRCRKERKLFPSPVKFIVSVSILLILVGLWVYFTTWYNNVNDSTYFVHRAFPFWTFSADELRKVVFNIRHVWLTEYFHPVVLVFLGASAVFILLHVKKISRFLLFTNLFLLAGITVFVMMFFWFFRDHDYYAINLYILPVFLLIAVLDIMHKVYPAWFASSYTKALFSLFLLFNLWYAKTTVRDRYESKVNAIFHTHHDLYTITPYLRSIGIGPRDTVISVPAGNHVGLYLMNVKGWTQYVDTRFGEGARVYYNRDHKGIETSISHGARYLIVDGIENLYLMPYLDEYAVHLTGRYGKTMIFDLKDSTRNYTVPDLIPGVHLSCDAEHLTEDGKYFISTKDSSKYEFGKNQSDRESRSGEFSVALNSEHQYGMTISMDSLMAGDQLVVSVWRKPGGDNSGSIVISREEPGGYYSGSYAVIEENNDGWEKIEKTLFLPASLQNTKIKIYLYYPGSDTVYFDDLSISSYRIATGNADSIKILNEHH